MNRIASAFANCQKKSLLIPFLTAGDPNYELSLELFDGVLQAGADIVEIGVPYSDPLADGPIIQRASLRSLNAGFSLPKAFRLTAELRKRHPAKPLVLFTYVNPVIQYTAQRFFAEAGNSGADGVIIPDLPLEESEPYRAIAERERIALIPLVTPVTPEYRVQEICRHADGFVYCVSSLGVTGMRSTLSGRVEQLVELVRSKTALPVAVGFGVSTPKQAADLSLYSDGVIVGSAVIRQMEKALLSTGEDDETGRIAKVKEEVLNFIQELAAAIHEVGKNRL